MNEEQGTRKEQGTGTRNSEQRRMNKDKKQGPGNQGLGTRKKAQGTRPKNRGRKYKVWKYCKSLMENRMKNEKE